MPYDLANFSGTPAGGHFGNGGKRTVVEDCLALDANAWMRIGILTAGARKTGAWCWNDAIGSGFRIAYKVDTRDRTEPVVGLRHSAWRAPRSPPVASYAVRLAATHPRLGRLRWWFRCPDPVDGRECGRHVGKLYLPPGGVRFGCRTCHDLTYRSCQDCHRYDGLFGILAKRWDCGRATVKERMASLAAA